VSLFQEDEQRCVSPVDLCEFGEHFVDEALLFSLRESFQRGGVDALKQIVDVAGFVEELVAAYPVLICWDAGAVVVVGVGE
jgi:hypothetical protein